MIFPISLTKTSYEGIKFFHSIAAKVKKPKRTQLTNSYCFFDSYTLYPSPEKTFTNISTPILPARKVIKKSFQSQSVIKNSSILILTEDKKTSTNNSNNDHTIYHPMLSNLPMSSMVPLKKNIKEKVDLTHFLAEARRKDYVREKEKDLLRIQSKVAMTSKKVLLMKSMCDFIYPYLLKAKEVKIQKEIEHIKKKKYKIKTAEIYPECIPVKSLYKQKKYRNRLNYYSDTDEKKILKFY